MKNDREDTRRRPIARLDCSTDRDRSEGRDRAISGDSATSRDPVTGLDRREFLKVGALGVAAGAVTGCGEAGPGRDDRRDASCRR